MGNTDSWLPCCSYLTKKKTSKQRRKDNSNQLLIFGIVLWLNLERQCPLLALGRKSCLPLKTPLISSYKGHIHVFPTLTTLLWGFVYVSICHIALIWTEHIFIHFREFSHWKVNSLATEKRDFLKAPLPLAPEFLRNLRLLGRRPTLQQINENLIKKYGTHFLVSATLGGKGGLQVTHSPSFGG